MSTFSYITLSQAQQALALRLGDPNNNLFALAELALYLQESLRTWNALTGTWNADYTFDITGPASSIWTNLRNVSGYPRQQTVTDAQIYTLIEYHFLEPPTGATWTGTSQFSISDLSGALQKRRDEIIQISGCNPVNASLASTPNTRRTVLPDNVLEIMRARFVPASGQGSPITLWRNDELGFEYFSPSYLQNQSGCDQQPGTNPQSYALIAGPPLTLDTDYTTQVPGSFDLIALESGLSFAPPASTLLGIPDDWSWVAKWGAMSDLLTSGSEKTDALRANYCLQRYKDGLTLIAKAPWIILAQINGVATDTISVAEMDAYSAEWDTSGNTPIGCIVLGGTDLIALSPVATSGLTSVFLTVIGNAPMPVLATDYLQVSRDVLDVILDYAQHIATFKKGGKEFQDTMPLANNFALAAIATNARLRDLGLFRDLLQYQSLRQNEQQERFEEVEQ